MCRFMSHRRILLVPTAFIILAPMNFPICNCDTNVIVTIIVHSYSKIMTIIYLPGTSNRSHVCNCNIATSQEQTITFLNVRIASFLETTISWCHKVARNRNYHIDISIKYRIFTPSYLGNLESSLSITFVFF